MTANLATARKMKSVERVITILNHFGPDRPTITLSETVRLLGIHKSSASRLLRQLAEEGFLRRLDEGTTYGVGLKLFEIGSLYALNNDLLQAAEAPMERLVERTGLTAQLCIRDGQEGVVVASRESTQLIRAAANLGGRLPLDVTASGRVLLMGHSDRYIRTLLQGSPRNQRLPIGELITHVRAAEKDGVAVVVGGYHPEVLSLAAPISASEDGVMAALCLVGAATSSVLDRVGELRTVLREEAADATRRLGR